MISEPPNFSTNISYSLDKVAGQISYNELKSKSPGGAVEGENLDLKAPQLISFAMGQIEQDTVKHMVRNGKNK
jgi:hypothetical protein